MAVLKIKRILANIRKKCLVVETAKATYEMPYSALYLKPTANDKLVSVWIDEECGKQAFGYRLESGKEEYVHVDIVLAVNKDPEYERDMLLYRMTVEAQGILKKKKIPKRELARKLKTSPKQLYRLLDQTFYGKTIDQMVKLLNALGSSVDLKVTPIKAARR